MSFSCSECSLAFDATKPARTCSDRCRKAASRRHRALERRQLAERLDVGLHSDPLALALALPAAIAALR